MSIISLFLARHKKFIIILFSVIFFSVTMVRNIPTWVLGSILNKYSNQKLKLYNTKGTFWQGSGLLVAVEPKTGQTSPLILLNWQVELGLTKLVDVKFFVGSTQLVDIYLDTKGFYLESLDMSLSIAQVTELFGLIKNLGLSGNINISAKNIFLGKQNKGVFNINLSTLSSSMSPVNPLGDYTIQFETETGKIQVNSSNNSILVLKGTGSTNELTLNAKVVPEKKEKLLQFITIMGIPQSDGSYSLKIF